MKQKRSLPIHFLIITSAIIIFAFSILPPAEAAKSTLHSLMRASRSMVTIRSEINVIAGSAQKPYIVKGTGVFLLQRRLKTVIFRRKGAGIILNEHGLIETNAHVVRQAGKIMVTLHDNTNAPARLVYVVPGNDIAFIKIHPPYPLRAVSFGDSDSLNLGDRVFSVGNSEILKNTITQGKITGIGKNKNLQNGVALTNILQINFDLYHGDSGTPVLDQNGLFVGSIAASQKSIGMVAFAVPSNIIRIHYKQMLDMITKKQEAEHNNLSG